MTAENDLMTIEGTPKTPSITLDAQKGVVEIKGRSIPENAVDFFQPVYEWIDKYTLEPLTQTTVNLKLEYFNTSSSKCILTILKKFEKLDRENQSKITINWYYEEDDEDMLEAGEDFDVIIQIPFKMIPMDEF